MNTERREGKPNELHEIIEVISERDIDKYFDFADKELQVSWGERGRPEHYSGKYFLANSDTVRLFAVKNQSGEIIAGGVVDLVDDDTKSRLELDKGRISTKKGALLEYATVQEESRNKGLNLELTKKRIEWAKEHGAEYVCSELEITNPVSVWVKIRDGFKLIRICKEGAGIHNPYFVAVKEFGNENPSELKTKPEYKEVEVNNLSYEELKDLFDEGWVGVDVKGIDKDPKNLTTPWVLVLEKKV